MTPETWLSVAWRPALDLLPGRFDTGQACAMILAICLQESGLRHRLQIHGPARGWPQFERNGLLGVHAHPASQAMAISVCRELGYEATTDATYDAVADNDVLSCAMARLLLWTLPMALPERGEVDGSWRQYVSAWRPGKPHAQTWAGHFARAEEVVYGT